MLVLTLVFLVLKLTGVISWSWWLVFLPLLVDVGVGILNGVQKGLDK